MRFCFKLHLGPIMLYTCYVFDINLILINYHKMNQVRKKYAHYKDYELGIHRKKSSTQGRAVI